MPRPEYPKIYHILHYDRLPSVLAKGFLFSDAIAEQNNFSGSVIGMSHIKQRRLTKVIPCISSKLCVGECVPFYFCPRSIMLYIIYMANHNDLHYRGGQEPIVHLEADLGKTIHWAQENNLKWAFSSLNASSGYADFSSDLRQLDNLRWDAIHALQWSSDGLKEGKQAEFLLENKFSYNLIERIGVHNSDIQNIVRDVLCMHGSEINVQVMRDWYY